MWKFGFHLIWVTEVSGFAILTPMDLKYNKTGFCLFFTSVSRRSRKQDKLNGNPLKSAEVCPSLLQEKVAFNWS